MDPQMTPFGPLLSPYGHSRAVSTVPAGYLGDPFWRPVWTPSDTLLSPYGQSRATSRVLAPLILGGLKGASKRGPRPQKGGPKGGTSGTPFWATTYKKRRLNGPWTPQKGVQKGVQKGSKRVILDHFWTPFPHSLVLKWPQIRYTPPQKLRSPFGPYWLWALRNQGGTWPGGSKKGSKRPIGGSKMTPFWTPFQHQRVWKWGPKRGHFGPSGRVCRGSISLHLPR